MQQQVTEAITLLRQLIATPSFSREEYGTAQIMQRFLQTKGIAASRLMNNVWAVNRHFDPKKKSILMQSHHDTVKPNPRYTLDPFMPQEKDGKLYGLGSNDASGALVSLLAAFLHYYPQENLKYNIIFAAVAEEEITGANGIESLLPEIGKIDFAIVGEPTNMHMAIAEKGLMVLDCETEGISGHAAREEGENAITKALPDINWFCTHQFSKVSPLLGPNKMSVTIINAGTQHNVVPSSCKFTVDIRVNECYTHEEVLDIVKQNVSCNVKPRSMRLRSSFIDEQHPLVVAGSKLGRRTYGSATLSDKSLMPFPTLKMGPGESARSHTADEFIYLSEIEEGIDIYIQLLKGIL